MKTLRLAAAVAAVSLLGIHGASAFSVDNTTGTNNNGSAKFSDPDDNVPFPHVSDDGQPANFQSQSGGNSGASFSLTPSNSEPDAFQRAQQRMQQ